MNGTQHRQKLGGSDTRSLEKNTASSEGACDVDVALGMALPRRAQQTDHSRDFMAVGANCVVSGA